MRTLLTGLLLFAIAAPLQAGGVHVGYTKHYGYGYRHHAPRYGLHHGYGYRYGHRHRHHHDRAGYLVAGLVLGSLVSDLAHSRPQAREVISRRPVVSPSPQSARGQPAPSQRPAIYLQKTADGRCLLIEVLDDGTEAVTEEPPESC